MRKPTILLSLAVLAALGACRTSPEPYVPVENVRYTALGAEPFWLLTIGDDRIVLRLGRDPQGRDYEDIVFPRTLPRTVDGVRSWESGDGGTAVIAVEARPGPCTGSRGRRYEDHVRVRLSGRELTGCGGRLLSGRRS